MRMILAPLVAIFTLAGCGGGGTENVKMFKYRGSVQCSGGGMTLEAMTRQLTDANIQVLSASCGSDGKSDAFAALCGAPDDQIGIFEIPAAQVQAASAISFAPLSNLPKAFVRACPA
ncbi:hypothetical protein [Massilia glaciei]|uniref:Lipoprotein n=1 Tax=Massilia glaciei TaxID=1524097 RepID=A0A2U2HIV3_9BURK|nr:hypothetical protein [Massilia glaciei]PWF46735.1 hypothetical protein C7C56_015590 [Massilia glaciei]